MASLHQIRVGGVAIGGGAPVVVQSMTLTKTHDVEATTAQIASLASAGCEIVRVAVPKREDAKALPLIVRLSPIPVIADIHFNASLALEAIDAGVHAVRINPGVRDWLLFAHCSHERGHAALLQALDARPLLALDMRLGEASGAATAVPLLRLACALHNQMATFAQAGVSEA